MAFSFDSGTILLKKWLNTQMVTYAKEVVMVPADHYKKWYNMAYQNQIVPIVTDLESSPVFW